MSVPAVMNQMVTRELVILNVHDAWVCNMEIQLTSVIIVFKVHFVNTKRVVMHSIFLP